MNKMPRLPNLVQLTALLGLLLIGADPAVAVELEFDARLTGFDYPFPVQTFAFKSQDQDLEMAYMILENGPDRPWITLLHGKNFNGAYWEQTARHLHDQGFNVLMPDQIGFGKSTKPRHYQFSFAALANNTLGLMDKLGIEQTVVVGHSMGGMLATRFALMHPERTTQLLLVNPIGLENYLEYVQYRDIGFFLELSLGQTAEKIRAYQQKNYYDGAWNDRYEALTEPLVGWVQGPDHERVAWNAALTYDMLFTQPVITEMGDLQVPTALILGTRDRTGPGRNWKRPGVTRELGRYDRLGAEVMEILPDGKLFELDGLGHLPQIENFGRFVAVLDEALEKTR